MEPARLTSSKQAPSPAGPFLGPRAKRVPNREKNATTLSGMLFRNFLAAGNGDLVFWPVFGLWHLEKSQVRVENTKTQFPGTRGPEMEKNIWE